MMQRKAVNGFTLLELMAAMAIFSLLSVMAYAGLQSAMTNKEHTENQAQRLVELQTAFMFIGRDFEQAISRSVRDGFGEVKSALEGGEFGATLISLTRAGRTNFLQIPRSTLQRVAYELEDDSFYRLSWPMLDQDFDQEPQRQELLKNVKKVSLRYLDNAFEWQDQWPAGFEENVNPTLLPRAIEATWEFDDVGIIRRVFRLSAGESVIDVSPSP